MSLIDPSKTKTLHGTGFFFKKPIGVSGAGDWNLLFVPPAFTASNSVDLILWFHGFKQANVLTYFDDAIRDGIWGAIESTGRTSLVLVAPSMGGGSLVETNVSRLESAAGFKEYVDHALLVLAEVKPTAAPRVLGATEAGPSEAPAGSPPNLRNLVLAGHSGGGRPLLAVSNLAHDYKARHLESWCFDGFYYGSDPWRKWCGMNGKKTLRGFYTEGPFAGSSPANAKAVLRAPAPANAKIEHDTADSHDTLPARKFGALLAASSTLGT